MSPRSPTSKKDRTRNFCSILYPESAPEDWEIKLHDLHVQACISPLHVGEKEDGSNLKPHYHIVLMYDSVKTLDQAANDFLSFGAIDRCQPVRALRSYLRYLCHLDEVDPYKPHFDIEQVKVIGDFDYASFIQSPEDDLNILLDITMFIKANHITSFIDFQCYNACHNLDWFRCIARSSTLYVTQLIKSERYDISGTTTKPEEINYQLSND